MPSSIGPSSFGFQEFHLQEALEYLREVFARLVGVPVEDLEDTESTFGTNDADFDEKFALLKLIALLEAPTLAGPSKLKAHPDRLSKIVEEVGKIQDGEPVVGFEASLAALVTLAPKFG